MVNFYALRIRTGKLTIDKVPELWRADVEEKLKEAVETA